MAAALPADGEIDVSSPFFVETQSLSLFTEWAWDVTERWSLIAVLRDKDGKPDDLASVNNTLYPNAPLSDPGTHGTGF